MIKAFKYRLYPTKKQEAAFVQTLTTCRHTYNNALEERIKTYKEIKKSVSYYDQTKSLKQNKNEWQNKCIHKSCKILSNE